MLSRIAIRSIRSVHPAIVSVPVRYSNDTARRFRKHEEAVERDFINKRETALLRSLLNKADMAADPQQKDSKASLDKTLKKHNISNINPELVDDLIKWRRGENKD